MVPKLRTVMGVGVGGFGIRGPRNKKRYSLNFTSKNRFNVSLLKCLFFHIIGSRSLQVNHNIFSKT